MKDHITAHRGGFGPGFTAITRLDDPDNQARIALGVLRLGAGEQLSIDAANETAWLLMSGTLATDFAGMRVEMRRRSLFDDSPACVHVPAGTGVAFHAVAECELTVYSVANPAGFPARHFAPGDVADELRGRGQVRDRSLRIVRTIFDGRNSPAAVQLVLGEVVTLPGGWSSYPPHHHAQPEIYHYRFTAPQGYGHAELGEAVVKVRQYDTIRIAAGHDHAQCAAPGYGMYYSWVIRHLPHKPYTVPDFTAEHAWTQERDAKFWWPQGLTDD